MATYTDVTKLHSLIEIWESLQGSISLLPDDLSDLFDRLLMARGECRKQILSEMQSLLIEEYKCAATTARIVDGKLIIIPD